MNSGHDESSGTLVFFLAMAMLVWTGGCNTGPVPAEGRGKTSERRMPLNVNIIQVQRAEDVPTVALCFGKLKPQRESRLGFGRGGRVKDVHHELGDAVSVGEVLAELQQSQLDRQKLTIDQNIGRLKSELRTATPARSASLQNQIRQLESQLADIEAELANGVILAPYSCIVTERSLDTGAMVSPATPAFQVIENAPPLVEAALPKEIASQANVGQPIAVILGDKEIIATLRAKSPMLDAAANQRVLLEFGDEFPTEGWSYGQVVEIRLFLGTGNSGVWLPYSALRSNANGLWSVFVAEQVGDVAGEEYRVERRVVQIIQLEDDAALVRGSLAGGEWVIADGGHRIVVGQSVTTIDVSSDFKVPFQAGAAE